MQNVCRRQRMFEVYVAPACHMASANFDSGSCILNNQESLMIIHVMLSHTKIMCAACLLLSLHQQPYPKSAGNPHASYPSKIIKEQVTFR